MEEPKQKAHNFNILSWYKINLMPHPVAAKGWRKLFFVMCSRTQWLVNSVEICCCCWAKRLRNFHLFDFSHSLLGQGRAITFYFKCYHKSHSKSISLRRICSRVLREKALVRWPKIPYQACPPCLPLVSSMTTCNVTKTIKSESGTTGLLKSVWHTKTDRHAQADSHDNN